jgi:hypothetical protein
MSKWELTVVENAGEIPADKVTEEIAVQTAPLLIDIKAQLMIAKPKTLVYTVGWRAIVWQNKETGQFKDLSEADYDKYITSGTINPTIGDGEVGKQDEVTSGDEGSTDGGTASSN